jgi:hypothetical protein
MKHAARLARIERAIPTPKGRFIVVYVTGGPRYRYCSEAGRSIDVTGTVEVSAVSHLDHVPAGTHVTVYAPEGLGDDASAEDVLAALDPDERAKVGPIRPEDTLIEVTHTKAWRRSDGSPLIADDEAGD